MVGIYKIHQILNTTKLRQLIAEDLGIEITYTVLIKPKDLIKIFSLDKQIRTLQANTSHSSTTNAFDDDDLNHSRYREERKVLPAENEHRRKPLESTDVTERNKIDLEKALEEKTYFQHELNRLKSEKDLLAQEKLEYKTKYDHLQEEIHSILLDRSKLEQKLTGELQEHFQEKQRSTDDLKKYRTQIEQLNIQLSDAEAHLSVLQTQKTSFLTSKNESEQHHLTHNLNEPLVVLTSTYPKSNQVRPNDELNKTFPSQQHNHENYLIENSRQIRSNTERVKSELDRLREDFDKLVLNYEPINNQPQLHSQIDTFRQFYEHEFRQRQLLMSKLTTGIKPTTRNNYHHHNPSSNGTSTLLKERPATATETSLPDQHLQTIPRQASALLTINMTNNDVMSSVELLRKHYHA
jgi:chromosome segregation ATPase